MVGKLIVLEGGEGGGKTTQIQRLHQWLQQLPELRSLQQLGWVGAMELTREPGGTAIGQRIRHLLLDPTGDPLGDRTELLLYAADRAQHVDTWIRPRLNQGDWVLCDRYTASTVAYQGYGRGLDLTLIDQLNAIATQGLVSDLTLWLDLPVSVGLARAQQRGERDRMEQASLDFHQRVRTGFTQVFQQAAYPVVQIDATPSEDVVTQQIQTVMMQWLTQWYPTHFPASWASPKPSSC
jgi:dTMP kinase